MQNQVKRHPVLAFVGPGRAGKDTACEFIRDHTALRFAGGCSFTVAPKIAESLGVPVEEAWANRHLQRDYWYRWCNEYRSTDPARIVRESLLHSDIVCGIRDQKELHAAVKEGLIDLVVYVSRDVDVDPTLHITTDDADIFILNNRSVEDYHRKLARLIQALRLPPKLGAGGL